MGKRLFTVLLALGLLVSAAPAAGAYHVSDLAGVPLDRRAGAGAEMSVPGNDAHTVPAAPPVFTGNTRLYILMYHSVVPDGTECNKFMTTESQFREDLRWMAQHGYTTVLPGELAAGQPLPERAVLITFDDGYADNYTLAYPLLKEFGAKAVVSPVVRFMLEAEDGGFLSWEMCREMLASGLVEIGTHTYDQHREAGGVSLGIERRRGENQTAYEARVFTDIETSIALLEDNLDCKVNFFAYPFGQTDRWANDFLRKHFAVTVTTAEHVADLSGGLYELPRYNACSEWPARMILPP